MEALLFLGDGLGLKRDRLPTPCAKEGELLLKVTACGVCGSEYALAKVDKKRSRRLDIPTIPGHEIVGEVECDTTGTFVKGDVVAVSPNSSCFTCRYCRGGITYMCEKRPLQRAETGGGYAQYAVVKPYQCYKIEKSSPLTAVMSETVACCLYAFSRVPMEMGEEVAILGAGCNALLFLQIAKQKGASRVVLFDNLDSRLNVAKKLGAEVSKEEPTGEFDVVIVSRGKRDLFEKALTIGKQRARILVYGVAPSQSIVGVSMHELWRREISIIGSRSYYGTFKQAVTLLENGTIKVASLVDRMANLDQIDTIFATPQKHIKAVITPWQESR